MVKYRPPNSVTTAVPPMRNACATVLAAMKQVVYWNVLDRGLTADLDGAFEALYVKV